MWRNVIRKYNSKRCRINEQIIAEKVRLVGEEGGPRVIPTKEAMEIAKGKSLDLVEISPNQEPPVTKVIDYSKFRFEQIKRAKESKKKQKIIHVKEIKVRPSIDIHDYTHKIKHAKEFIEKGDKVKFTVMFRGREIVHKDLGFKVMANIKEDMAEITVIEKEPSQEGRNITMIVAPGPAGSQKKKN